MNIPNATKAIITTICNQLMQLSPTDTVFVLQVELVEPLFPPFCPLFPPLWALLPPFLIGLFDPPFLMGFLAPPFFITRIGKLYYKMIKKNTFNV